MYYLLNRKIKLLMDIPILTYQDVTIYSSDLKCLGPNQWLNDQIISFALAKIESTVCTNYTIKFMDASLVSCIRLQISTEDDADEISTFAESLALISYQVLIIPITNKINTSMSSSHWSLLYIDLKNNIALHFDSSLSYNYKAANIIIGDIYRLCSRFFII